MALNPSPPMGKLLGKTFFPYMGDVTYLNGEVSKALITISP
jgi:hypothetical protein